MATVRLHDVSANGLELRAAANAVPSLNCSAHVAYTCAYATVYGTWRASRALPTAPFEANVTATIAANGRDVELAVPPPYRHAAALSVRGTSYGYGAVPFMTLYDKGTGLPVLPWNRTLSGE